MQPLILELTSKVVEGLQKCSIIKPSQWANEYRQMSKPFPGPWTFKYHPWLLDMHDAKEPIIIGKKASQMGYTQWAINTAFFNIDVNKVNVLYLLPTSGDASDFSVSRFDTALDLSPHLEQLFDNVNNVKLKRAGSNILYVRGCNSRNQLKSIDVSIIVYDEYDEMPIDNIILARKRLSGQQEKDCKELLLSTPTIENAGIDKEHKLSTQEIYHFRCPSCSRFINLRFPESIVITADKITDKSISNSHYICTECHNILPNETKVDWLKHSKYGGTGQSIKTHKDRFNRGFHVSHLYSMAVAGKPSEIATNYLRSQFDDLEAQEFFNSDLGECFEARGARITKEQIDSCVSNYYKGVSDKVNRVVTMGVDVGKVLHVVIKEYYDFEPFPSLTINDTCKARLLYEGTTEGTIDDFNKIYELFFEYKCHSCGIDIEPENREALRLAQKIYGRVYLVDYLYSQKGKEITRNDDELVIKCNRTAWLDISQGRYKHNTIILPIDTSHQFKKHIREPVRVLREDKYGNTYGVYVNSGPDHFAHADNYSEIILAATYSLAKSENIYA